MKNAIFFNRIIDTDEAQRIIELLKLKNKKYKIIQPKVLKVAQLQELKQ